ncbi:cobyrinate a,c-diamide synthase [Burkholderia plantarii]|uniref:cobyrinate a,c-diamide synthase n=1 Tax=Burkholderia plantarii TaxID=41899 RepID=UPI0018DB76F1|nr:cobyrinate a,c-diamide synthase [Burkholderia plantarii]MBI0328753.1 cobyrinate a,c-diamide synthase [Burkholderia plantarii]
MTAAGTPACPALFVSASGSGQGKTSVTAGLARLHRRLGRRVRVFKTGPDFLDPMILARASGAEVESLDLGMVGEAGCRALLARAAAEADVILIEGVMGLYDGTPSSADLACRLGVPVAVVISAKSMAQTFGALAFGLARFRPGLPFHGVLANRVGSARHATLLQAALPDHIRWLGHLSTDAGIALPERHLGLHQAGDIADLDARLERAADALAATALAELPPAVGFAPPEPAPPLPRWLDGLHVAVARDAAFSFIYPANLALLATLGARVTSFSPLADEPLPDCDALYLPGGYPELHAARLAASTRSAAGITAHVAAGRTVLAECGGLLYLCETLTDADGITTPMLGLLPGAATMQRRFTALGMQRLDTPHGPLQGHTFHYSKLAMPLAPAAVATRPDDGARGEAVYRHGPIVASYLHAYWPSNPRGLASLLRGEWPDASARL